MKVTAALPGSGLCDWGRRPYKAMAMSKSEHPIEGQPLEWDHAIQELDRARKRADTLYRIVSELSATLDLDRVFARALRILAEALGAQQGLILLLDQGSETLYVRATLDTSQPVPPGGLPTRLKKGSGLAGRVLETREPVLLIDAWEDDRWREAPDFHIDARSLAVAPLALGGGDVLGVLIVGHRQTGFWDQEDLQLVVATATQVAAAIGNAELYAFITDQADQMGGMLQTMQAEARRNRAILESIADGVLVLDPKGRVLLVNPAAEEMLGLSAMVLEGQHLRHMLGLGDMATKRALADQLYAELRSQLEVLNGVVALSDSKSVRLESDRTTLAVNIAPLIFTLGEPPGLVAAMRDVSREAEVERLKNEFISTVSHELRTPMTSIKGYTDLLFLGMAGGLSDAQRSFLQIIKTNADRLTALVNDILDISRIETGRLRLTIEALDLGKLISQAVTSFREQYRAKGLTLEWQVPKDLPEVRGDAGRVSQVLVNLIANAWQYTPAGGRVTVSAHADDGSVQVDVTDTGIGIAPENLNRVFDRFFRANHSLVQEVEGTGLGLSIVKMFVEMLGGQVWATSEPGAGSTFSFTLPLMEAEVQEAVVIEPPLISTESPAFLRRRPKILLVESDRDLALELRHRLDAEGYQVLLAGTGEDALWLAREEQPQLVTIDIMLPDIDGFGVLEKLKQHAHTAPIPVIIVSLLRGLEQDGYTLGAVDYLIKPFQEEQLLESVRFVMSAQDPPQDGDLLVVDDDPDILELLARMLNFHGYQVRTAFNGWEALACVEESPPAAILLDLKMPRMDGYEVIQHLKQNRTTRFIPIIVITASPVDKERDRVRILGTGSSQYITKPLSIETLVKEIRASIEERQVP